tara:strand:+ start:80 stop:388 length:309 start_codon:yes stop_codon:yes gene_type:complete
MTQAHKDCLTPVLEKLKPELSEIVESIEARPPTTKDWYGDYMRVLSTLASNQLFDDEKTNAKFFGLALIHAGANADGVVAAMQVCGFGSLAIDSESFQQYLA